MKKMKKLLSIVSAAIMTVAMATTAFAATTVTRPEGDTTHTYNVWQIMTGTVDASNNISDATWGANATKSGAVSNDDLTAIKGLTGSNRNILNTIETFVKFKEDDVKQTPFATINAEGNISRDLAPGYYLVEDTTTIDDTDETPDSLNTYVVKVTDGNSLVIAKKRDVPELTKTVKQNTTVDASEISTANTHGAVADYAIGESIEFKLKATLPSNFADYKYYKCTFTDTMTGLKYKDGMTVEIFDSSNVSRGVVKATEYTGTPTAGAKTFNLVMNNLVDGVMVTKDETDKTITLVSTDYIVVTYNAEFDTADDNFDYNKANPNEASLLYSSNPNASDGGELDKTPKSKAVVFTYKVTPKKVNALTNAPIEGVKFYLKDEAGTKYGVLENGVFKQWVTDKSRATELTSESTGYFDIKGLDEGTYTLEEIEAASGYVQIEPFTFTISAYWKIDATNLYVLDTEKKLVTTSDTANTETVVNSSDIIIKNTPKSALPTTGGIGTTVFYVVGGIMMVGATVLLIIKKKMSKA